jgi:hypothetical protein
MNLTEAIEKCECDVLRKKLKQFLVDIAKTCTVIPTLACPVCSNDLLSTYEPSPVRPYRGTCSICHYAIQMRHSILHEEHIKIDLTICGYELNLPVGICQTRQTEALAKLWTRMGFVKGHRLTSFDNSRWMDAVQSVIRTFDPERSTREHIQ